MNGNEHLTAREFYKGIERLESRFDRLDTKVDSHGETLAVHHSRLKALEVSSTTRTRKALGWGAAMSGGLVTLFEAVRSYLR